MNFFSQFDTTTLPGKWLTVVTVPDCRNFLNNFVIPVVSASNGTIVAIDTNRYLWTRAPGAVPGTALAGSFTADCIDHQGLHAHPLLAVNAAALP